MKLIISTLLVLILAGAVRDAGAQDVLATLKKEHPRLMVLDQDIQRIKGLIESDAACKSYYEQLRKSAEKLLEEPVSQRVLIGPRLLGVSREVMRRTTLLGGMYRITGDRRFAARARDEMLAAAKFSDWNPSHFLDVAEMTAGLGIGYDWTFDALSDEERGVIRDAILAKGLEPGLKVHASGKGFPRNTNNWNQVCNGGLTVGALAIADEQPEVARVAREILEAARESLPRAMKQFEPDGGCDEGPGYWSYATHYIVYYLAALETALGTDLGFKQSPGLAETGLFRIHTIGPTGRTFNYADAGSTVGPAANMFYLARVFNRPVYAAHERMVVRDYKAALEPFHLMWFNPDGNEGNLAALPMSAQYARIDVAVMRSGWSKDAAFVGFKGGFNAASHAHLDLGSFVYEADGVRWALDLGSDDYNLPGYFGGKRWSYYRLATESHNTLMLDGENQALKGKSPLVAFAAAKRNFAVADLTDAYGKKAEKVLRGVELLPDRALLVQDEIQAPEHEPVEVTWTMLTDAKAEVNSDGNEVILRKSDKTLAMRLVLPKSARFEIIEGNPPAPQRRHPDAKRIVVRLVPGGFETKGKVREAKVAVLLTPGGRAGAGAVPEIVPLAKW